MTRHAACEVEGDHDRHQIFRPNNAVAWCGGDRRGMNEQSELDHSVKSDGLGQVLRDWWVDLAATEADRVIPKAIEYGSTDLLEIGRTLAFTMRRFSLSESRMAELGVYFYLVGKMARWTDAVKEGRDVSDDTLHDIGVYVRMAQRIRAVGGWPFGPEGEDG